MSFNPTQSLKCHLCGEYYKENQGHKKQVCLDRLASQRKEAAEHLRFINERFETALKEYA